MTAPLTRSGSLDIRRLREDFPLLKRQVHGRPIVYLDNAATSQKPQAVIDALVDYYSNYNANIHRGIYTIAEEATLAYEAVRDKVSAFINAPDRDSIVFTRNTTEAINMVTHIWGRRFLKAGDEILLTEMEHHSNLIPWQMLAQEKGVELRFIPLAADATLDLSRINDLITPRTKLVSVAHMSNVLGTINPVETLAKKAHTVGARVLLDGAQSVPHMPVDVQALDCDFLAFSSHKMMGPTGVGVLYAKRDLLEQLGPFLGGGEMVLEVWKDHADYKDAPWRFEAGTPNIADVIAYGTAIDYLTNLGMERVREHEKEITAYALQEMEKIGARVFGPTDIEKRGGAVSFWYEDIHPHDLATLLDRESVCIRAGNHCAQPLMRCLDVPATARASFYAYNLSEEVDALVSALKKARDIFHR